MRPLFGGAEEEAKEPYRTREKERKKEERINKGERGQVVLPPAPHPSLSPLLLPSFSLADSQMAMAMRPQKAAAPKAAKASFLRNLTMTVPAMAAKSARKPKAMVALLRSSSSLLPNSMSRVVPPTFDLNRPYSLLPLSSIHSGGRGGRGGGKGER